MSIEAIFKVAFKVFNEWPRRDAKTFQAMSTLDVRATSHSFSGNQKVRGLRLQISSSKHCFQFRCNLKYLVSDYNTRQSLFATSILDAQTRLELRQEDKDTEQIELVAQCKVG